MMYLSCRPQICYYPRSCIHAKRNTDLTLFSLVRIHYFKRIHIHNIQHPYEKQCSYIFHSISAVAVYYHVLRFSRKGTSHNVCIRTYLGVTLCVDVPYPPFLRNVCVICVFTHKHTNMKHVYVNAGVLLIHQVFPYGLTEGTLQKKCTVLCARV